MSEAICSFFRYTNSAYTNLKSYIDHLIARVNVLEARVITNFGIVESPYSMGQIIADGASNTFLDRLVTGNPYGGWAGRVHNVYPNATAPLGSTATLITYEGGTSYNVYSMYKNDSGQWEYFGIVGGTNKISMPFN